MLVVRTHALHGVSDNLSLHVAGVCLLSTTAVIVLSVGTRAVLC